MPENTTEAQAIAQLATANIAPQLHQAPDSVLPFLILKDGTTCSLEHLLAKPLRKRASARFTEPQSFIAYVQAHTEPSTLLVGEVSETCGTFRAIFDYVGCSKNTAHAGDPNWGDHTAELALEITTEWKRWTVNNSQPMPQTVFAEYLEDNARDIIVPSGAELLEVAQTLQAAKSVNFRSATRLANGQHELSYVEQIDATAGRAGNLQVPEWFTIRIAPFVGTPPIEIEARLRYRINEGKLLFFYRLMQPHLVIAKVWGEVRQEIEAATGLNIHRGTAHVITPKP